MALMRRNKETPESLQGVTEQDLVAKDMAAPAPRQKLSPALAGGLLALPLLALGAWYFLGSQSVDSVSDDATTISSLPMTSASPSASPGASPGASPTSVPPGRVLVPQQVPPGPNARVVKPGQAGIKPPSVPQGVPVVAPAKKGAPPRLVPAAGAPTPVQPPPGLGAIPGRRGVRDEVVVSPRRGAVSSVPPAQFAQLKALWKQGARAKQSGDIAGARRAWEAMLKLRPGHPGVQEAIDKLGG
jgi:hypothetical protein